MKQSNIQFKEGFREESLKREKVDLLLYIQTEAMQDGLTGKPSSIMDYQLGPISKIQSTIQGGIDDLQKSYLPHSNAVKAKQIQLEASEKINKDGASSNQTEHNIVVLEKEVEELEPDRRLRLKRIFTHICLWLVAGLEGVFSYDAWRNINLSIPASAIASIAISLAIGIGTPIAANYIHKATTKLQLRIRLLVVNIPFLAGFYIISVLRAKAFNYIPQFAQTSKVKLPEVPPMQLTIISYLLFLVALAACIYYWKSPEESARESLYLKRKGKLSELQNQRNSLLESIDETKTNTTLEIQNILEHFEEARATERELVAYANYLLTEYIQTNRRFRKDDLPAFMINEHQFIFKTYFK